MVPLINSLPKKELKDICKDALKATVDKITSDSNGHGSAPGSPVPHSPLCSPEGDI